MVFPQNKHIYLFLVLIHLLIGIGWGSTMKKPNLRIQFPIKSVYGLNDSPQLQFPGKTDEDVIKLLKENKINSVFGGYKNTELRKLLKQNQINVYAEITLFAGTGLWKTNPEYRPITSSGKPIEKDDWYGGLCPNQPKLQEKRLHEISELIDKYDVDGIWLDFIRYPTHWEVKNPRLDQTCFCPICLAKFKKDTRIQIPTNLTKTADKADWILKTHNQAWIDWKCQNITTFTRKAYQQIKSKNPSIVVGFFGVPWTPDDFNNAIHSTIGQNYKTLSPYVDVFTPMVYHKLCYRDINWINVIINYQSNQTNKPIVPIIQACSIPSELSNKEFTSAINEALRPPSKGVIIFTLDYAIKENKFNNLKSKW